MLSLVPVPAHARDGDFDEANIDQQGFKGSIQFSQYNTTHVRIVVKMDYQGNETLPKALKKLWMKVIFMTL